MISDDQRSIQRGRGTFGSLGSISTSPAARPDNFTRKVASGKHTKNHGESTIEKMGISQLFSMAILNSDLKLPEGIPF